jgi:hypothetical protein
LALEPTDDGLDAIFQVDGKTDEDIEQGRALGCSAMFDEDWYDKESRTNVGAVMRHICITNVPVLKRLRDFEPVLLAEPDAPKDVVYLSERKAAPMGLEELLAKLKEEHDIDVEALKAAATRADSAEGVVKTVREALAGAGVALSEDVDLPKLVGELAKDKKTAEDSRSDLQKQVDGLTVSLGEITKRELHREADGILEPAIKKGYITDADKATYVALSEQEGGLDRLRAIIKPYEDLPPKVELTDEDGTTQGGAPPPVTAKLSEADAEAEAKRLIELGRQQGVIRTRIPAAA